MEVSGSGVGLGASRFDLVRWLGRLGAVLPVIAVAGCAPEVRDDGDGVPNERGRDQAEACFAARGLPDRTIDDDLSVPSLTWHQTDRGLPYIEARGLFEGTTDRGAFRVPYLVTVPDAWWAQLGVLRDVILFEPPHFFASIGGLNWYYGRDFLLGRGGAHAAVGWALGNENELDHACFDPTLPDDERCFIEAEWDAAILTEFAVALLVDPDVEDLVGGRTCRYATGYSQSSAPYGELISGGQADEVLDLVSPFTTSAESFHDVGWQQAVADGIYSGKLVIVNSEFEEQEWLADDVHDDGTARGGYRYYATAGTAHIPDILQAPDPLWSNSSPADYLQEVRGRFLQAHRWVTEGARPDPSTQLLSDGNGDLVVDGRGNAIVVDVFGRQVPRQPYIALGEARFVYSQPERFFLIGDVEDVFSVEELGFADHAAYRRAFVQETLAWALATGITAADAQATIRRASCAPWTYTQLYENDYDTFVAGGCD